MAKKTSYEGQKDAYLTRFKRENSVGDLFSDNTQESGEKIVSLLKKEGLTYDDAYASLQYAYDKIKYESNFLKLN